MNEREVKGCEVCKAKHAWFIGIPYQLRKDPFHTLTFWFESFAMEGVLFSTIPFRISASNCDRPSIAFPFPNPLPFPLCIGMSGGGGGGGGANTAVVDAFVIVSIFRWKI